MANLAEACCVDIQVIARTMVMDGRITPKFLHPCSGYGGSFFPKDMRSVASTGNEYGVKMSLIEEAVRAIEAQKRRVVEKLKKAIVNLKGKKVAISGLAFKTETDYIRESPAIGILDDLLLEKADIGVHDPKVITNFRKVFKKKNCYYENEFDAIENADCVVISTGWNEYRNIDVEKVESAMRRTHIIDCGNILVKQKALNLGLES